MPQNPQKMLIGAVIAAALAIAVYYGAISQQQASTIQTQANQALGTAPAQQQVVPPTQTQTTQAPAANGMAPQSPAPAPRQ